MFLLLCKLPYFMGYSVVPEDQSKKSLLDWSRIGMADPVCFIVSSKPA
jgi:hypothetical protein